MDAIYNKGSLLQIKTNNGELFEGQFHSQSKDKFKITLFNVKDMPDGNFIDGLSHYYFTDIANITTAGEQKSAVLTNHFGATSTLPLDEMKTYECMAAKYIFINQLDNTFYDAIADLMKHSYIAVGTDCAELGRKCNLPLLTMSTPDQIYIFDVQVMQHHLFNRGLKALLESDCPKKIIHDCRKLSDCLYHNHAIMLQGVFDTQVSDAIIHRQRYGRLPTEVRNLQKCLTEYLGISPQYLDQKQVDIAEWSKRPLLVAIKESSALNILYLHRLSETLHEEMFSQFNRGTQCYLDNLRKCDDFEAWTLAGRDDQLPKAFKETIEQY